MSFSSCPKWRAHSAASARPTFSSLCHRMGWNSSTLHGVTSRRWHAANGHSAADEHSPVTMPVARRPRRLMSVISDIAQ